MKLPRRQFLHMAAGAAVLHAVSRTASAQVESEFETIESEQMEF